ncbi:hypothetical protein ILYODFUR_013007 [Ilyodon furcidens]|uniref:Uncharacterized protein n=1 Tax=Ilyodon furcidens TaxID=33524 RepID=A0ABV0TVD6_9TELE
MSSEGTADSHVVQVGVFGENPRMEGVQAAPEGFENKLLPVPEGFEGEPVPVPEGFEGEPSPVPEGLEVEAPTVPVPDGFQDEPTPSLELQWLHHRSSGLHRGIQQFMHCSLGPRRGFQLFAMPLSWAEASSSPTSPVLPNLQNLSDL